uniref:Uncharacterized protein n=1 Tax=Glossina pallidipes TaxID=7398 RepID=A0A1A9ZH05_GLOPL
MYLIFLIKAFLIVLIYLSLVGCFSVLDIEHATILKYMHKFEGITGKSRFLVNCLNDAMEGYREVQISHPPHQFPKKSSDNVYLIDGRMTRFSIIDALCGGKYTLNEGEMAFVVNDTAALKSGRCEVVILSIATSKQSKVQLRCHRKGKSYSFICSKEIANRKTEGAFALMKINA